MQALLPDSKRVRDHIRDGDVALGDFLTNYSILMQRQLYSRPLGRSKLSRGDSDVFFDAATPIRWEVSAVVDNVAIIAVRMQDKDHSVTIDFATRHVAGLTRAMANLFADASEVSVWNSARYLDLWNWKSALPLHGEHPVVVREDTNHWLVEGENFTLEWVPGPDPSLRLAAGRMPSHAFLEELFLKVPKIL